MSTSYAALASSIVLSRIVFPEISCWPPPEIFTAQPAPSTKRLPTIS